MAQNDPPKEPASPPSTANLEKLMAASKDCLVCPFARSSTQTVFGEGHKGARLMLIGECPGNVEDLKGEPFVGPSGKLLRKMLEELGADPKSIYFTNAVKHFKFMRRGKIRLHSKPSTSEINACHPWLVKEIEVVQPKVILALGATAAYSFFGRRVSLGRERGRWLTPPLTRGRNIQAMVSWHPSGILRASDDPRVQEKKDELVRDLKAAWEASQK